jgi:N-acetylglutamate synthase-like GNAT family acetyltransferase
MQEELIVRKADISEKDALTDLCMRSKQSNGYDDAFMTACADELRVHDSWFIEDNFWLAESGDGQIVGCIRLSMEKHGGIGELETCFVDPNWQGKQVGRKLFDQLIAKARENELMRLGLDADPSAEPFYARMGFTTVGRTPSGSIAGRTLPRMELNLNAGQGQ